jgi:hypothetical protein
VELAEEFEPVVDAGAVPESLQPTTNSRVNNRVNRDFMGGLHGYSRNYKNGLY